MFGSRLKYLIHSLYFIEISHQLSLEAANIC